MRKLARLLGPELGVGFAIAHNYAVGLMQRLWEYSARYAPEGDLSQTDPDDIADGCGWDGAPDALLEALREAAWLDEIGDCLLLHDWPEHCEDSVHMRLGRAVLYFADGSRPRLTRFSKAERAEIEKLYAARERMDAHGERTDDGDVRTASAVMRTKGASVRTNDPSVRTTMPSHAMLSQAEPLNSDPSLSQDTHTPRAPPGLPGLERQPNGRSNRAPDPLLEAAIPEIEKAFASFGKRYEVTARRRALLGRFLRHNRDLKPDQLSELVRGCVASWGGIDKVTRDFNAREALTFDAPFRDAKVDTYLEASRKAPGPEGITDDRVSEYKREVEQRREGSG